MSFPGWNPADIQQHGGSGGGEGQEQVGAIKMFDPNQFQPPHGAGASPVQGQGHQSAWDSWGSWNWNSENQNGAQSGQAGVGHPGQDHATSTSNGVLENTGHNGHHYQQQAQQFHQPQQGQQFHQLQQGQQFHQLQQGQQLQEGQQLQQLQQGQQFHQPQQGQQLQEGQQFQQLQQGQQFQQPQHLQQGQQHPSHFYNPQHLQPPEMQADSGHVTPQQQAADPQQHHQHQLQYHAAYGYHWESQQWSVPAAAHVSHQTLDGQAVSAQGHYGSQVEQSQQSYFDHSAWTNSSGHDQSQAYHWGGDVGSQSHQTSGNGAEQTVSQGNEGDLTQNTKDQPYEHFGQHDLYSDRPVDGISQVNQSGADSFARTAVAPEGVETSQQHQTFPVTLEPEGGGPHHAQDGVDSDAGSGPVAAFPSHADVSGMDAAHVQGVDAGGTALPMHHLKVSTFARTDSGISNASLQTLNLSADEDAENGVDEMVRQMDSLTVVGGGPGDPTALGSHGHQVIVSRGQEARSADFSDLRSTASSWMPPADAQTPQTVAGSFSQDRLPAGIDWDMVPQAHSSASHSRNSSLDNGITFSAKPHEQNGVGFQPRPFASDTALSSQHNAMPALYSPTVQESESFTAISSTSGSVDGLMSQGSEPVTSSTPYTSPGGRSLSSQPAPQASQTSSPGYTTHTLDQNLSPPGTGSLPSSSLIGVQTKDPVDSPPKTTGSFPQQNVVPGGTQQPTADKSLEGIGGVSKMTESSATKSSYNWRPPPSPSPHAELQPNPEKEVASLSSPQRRSHQSAFQPVHSHRGKHNMSPATTLWDNLDSNPTSNILLAPAAPLIIPSLNPSASTATTTATTTAVTATSSSSGTLPRKTSSDSLHDRQVMGKDAGRRGSERGSSHRSNSRRPAERKDGDRSTGTRGQTEELSRSREDDSRSFGSLDELDAAPDFDEPRDRTRGYGRDPRYDPYYDRPSSRVDGYRDGYRDEFQRSREAYHGYNREYRDAYYDERYDRPRSRQDEERSSRPSSRLVRDADRPKSRSEYDRDRDAYYQHQREYRYRGYPGYENYPKDYYYDERDRMYRYYPDSRYRRGYAEEMGFYGQYDSQDYYRKQSYPSSQTEREQEAYKQAYGGYGAYDPYTGYYDQYHYGYYADEQHASEAGYQRGRMTPPKYLLPHMRTCFGPGGQLVVVQPNRPTEGQPAVVEIHEVATILQDDPEMEELKAFPGPLVRNQTHKNDVLVLCQKRAKECTENIDMVDRESAELIWRFLELLLKQNGSIIGTDIADLLLAGHEPSTHEYSVSGMRIIPSADQLDITDGDESRTSSPAVHISADRSILAAERSIITATQQLEETTDRFRHYLLYGRKKEALDWAMKHNLWGHALFLASKMDARSHANVMTRFANTAMRMNDPLQTLYQLMSGRQPASVTNIMDERWGDWRPHLAMILSNHSNRPDLVKKSVVTLGDTLATKHCLHASHFCYLMAQVEFGSFLKKTSKLVLIGSNHNLLLKEFANNAAIQCTEVYEYAQSLGNTRFILPHFQVYKFLYACRLAEYGLAQEAFNYCELIALQVLQCPARYHPTFIVALHSIASQLKHCDPRRLHEGLDLSDPEWLMQLSVVCQGYEDGTIQFKSGTATPMTGYGGVTPSSESGEVASYGMDNSTTSGGGLYPQDPSVYSGAAFNHQQVQQAGAGGTVGGEWFQQQQAWQQQQQLQQQQQAWQQQQQQQIQQQQQQGVEQFAQYSQQQGVTGGLQQQQQLQTQHSVNQHQLYHHPQQYDPSQHQPQQWLTYDYSVQSYNSSDPLSSTAYQGQVRAGGEQSQSQPSLPAQVGSMPQAGQGYSASQRGSIASTSSGVADNVDDEDDDDDEEVDNRPGSSHFDYFGAASQQIVAPPHRYRTTSTSSTSSTGHRRHRNPSESSTNSVRAAGNGGKPVGPTVKPPEPKKDGGSAQKADTGGGGWLGGFLSKFGRRDKNEMILPDDKNPSIVWDPVKKVWINKDGDSSEEQSAAPPPKAVDLGKMAASSAPAPVMNGPPPGNMFSLGRGKGRGARGQYVDVLNPAGKTNTATVPSSLFNVLPASGSTTAVTAPSEPKLFNPSGGPSASSQVEDLSKNVPTPPSDEAQEVGNAEFAKSALTSASQQPALPMMFNPAQLTQSSGTATATASTGLKFGQRRVYPK